MRKLPFKQRHCENHWHNDPFDMERCPDCGMTIKELETNLASEAIPDIKPPKPIMQARVTLVIDEDDSWFLQSAIRKATEQGKRVSIIIEPVPTETRERKHRGIPQQAPFTQSI